MVNLDSFEKKITFGMCHLTYFIFLLEWSSDDRSGYNLLGLASNGVGPEPEPLEWISNITVISSIAIRSEAYYLSEMVILSVAGHIVFGIC